MSKLTQDMAVKVNEHWGNLEIKPYSSSNYEPLMPILQQEFPNWNSKKIKSYMNLANGKDKSVAGEKEKKNASGYYVGCLIYTFQKIDAQKFDLEHYDQKEIFNIFVVENINSCIPILQKQIFLALVDEVVKIASANNCDYVELPTLTTQSYLLVKEKYNNQIENPKTFRTYIKI